ncbi:hypothetical protein B0H14DRAFT_3784554 [Mycena olivaceomarginata]|nr:hypothetical protein B0H14DRAFT_3784554 [Mycena olivaceomarginata]
MAAYRCPDYLSSAEYHTKMEAQLEKITAHPIVKKSLLEILLGWIPNDTLDAKLREPGFPEPDPMVVLSAETEDGHLILMRLAAQWYHVLVRVKEIVPEPPRIELDVQLKLLARKLAAHESATPQKLDGLAVTAKKLGDKVERLDGGLSTLRAILPKSMTKLRDFFKKKSATFCPITASGFNFVVASLSSSALPPLPRPKTVEPRLDNADDPNYNVERNPHVFADSKGLLNAAIEAAEVEKEGERVPRMDLGRAPSDVRNRSERRSDGAKRMVWWTRFDPTSVATQT